MWLITTSEKLPGGVSGSVFLLNIVDVVDLTFGVTRGRVDVDTDVCLAASSALLYRLNWKTEQTYDDFKLLVH